MDSYFCEEDISPNEVNKICISLVFEGFYSKVVKEETFQIIQVQMRSNISSIHKYSQMHWHLDAFQRAARVKNSISV